VSTAGGSEALQWVFALVELAELPIPPDWPQFGLELAAGWPTEAGRGASPTRG